MRQTQPGLLLKLLEQPEHIYAGRCWPCGSLPASMERGYVLLWRTLDSALVAFRTQTRLFHCACKGVRAMGGAATWDQTVAAAVIVQMPKPLKVRASD
jgi:hypothetical protein